jgi:small subunit ribosomal protein S6
MSKTKDLGDNHYEILFIIPNNYTEDEAKTINTNTEKIIKKLGGEINYQEYWGKKKLAYEIKKNHYGYYSLMEFDLDGVNLAELDRLLRLSKEILRHQIIKKAKRSLKEIELEKERQAKSIQGEKNDKKEEIKVGVKIEKKEIKKEDNKKVEKKEEEKKPKEEKIDKVKTKKTEDKSELKDLDEKLEGILNAKDLI